MDLRIPIDQVTTELRPAQGVRVAKAVESLEGRSGHRRYHSKIGLIVNRC